MAVGFARCGKPVLQGRQRAAVVGGRFVVWGGLDPSGLAGGVDGLALMDMAWRIDPEIRDGKLELKLASTVSVAQPRHRKKQDKYD